MKIRNFFCTLMVVLCSNCLLSKPITQLGIAGGLGQSFEINYRNKTYNKPSFSGGIFVTFFDFAHYDLRTTLGYSLKGSNRIHFPITQWDSITQQIIFVKDSLVDDSFRKSHTMSFSGMSRFKLPLSHTTPYIEIGPRVDYLLKRTFEEKHLGANEIDVTDKSRQWLVGFNIGLGFDYRVNNFVFSPNIKTNIDCSDAKAEFNEEYRNFRYFGEISVGYSF